jgi:tetratricopeptide (TPR) repeat protein
MVVLMVIWVAGVLSAGFVGVTHLKELGTKMQQLAREKSQGSLAPMPPAPKDDAAHWDRARVPVPKSRPMIRRPGVDHDGYPRDAVDKIGLLALLRAGQYEALTQHLQDLQTEFEADHRKEEWVTQAFDAFYTPDGAVGDHIDRWVIEAPYSFAPHVARAQHHIALAWHYRGGDYATKTDDDRLKKFRELASLGELDVLHAMDRNPKLVIAYQIAIWTAAYGGINTEKRKHLDSATAICPDCFRVRSKYLFATRPRWGGKLEDMERFAIESQAFAGQNPRLKALLGYADQNRASAYREQKKYAAAMDAIEKALTTSDYHAFHDERARIFSDLEQTKEALEEMEKAVDHDPQNASYLRRRARLLIATGKLREGTDDLKLASLLDPASEDTRWSNDNAVKQLVRHGHQRHIANDAAGAASAYDMALELEPGNVDALERKARIATGVSEVARLEAAALADPTNFDVYKQLDDELVKTREFPRIVSHWNRYLASKPDDARGFLERGGANFHAGNIDAAIADLERACTAGLQEGCRGAQSIRARKR